jgi:hypothetical protein
VKGKVEGLNVEGGEILGRRVIEYMYMEKKEYYN